MFIAVWRETSCALIAVWRESAVRLLRRGMKAPCVCCGAALDELRVYCGVMRERCAFICGVARDELRAYFGLA